MNTRHTSTLAIVAAGMLGTALWLSSERRPTQEHTFVESALPGLDAKRLNSVNKVTLTLAGGQVAATLERQSDQWLVAERNYVADTGRLRELLLNLSQARRIEAKTANPKLYEKLGVEPVSETKATGVELKLEGGGDPLRLIIGRNPPGGSGTYVRESENATSWLIDRNIAVEKTAANWLAKDLADIATDRIERVEMKPATGEKVSIVEAEGGQGDFKLESLPKGREQASDYVADATAGLLQGLKLDDVADAGSTEADTKSMRSTRFVLKDGVEYAMESWQREDKTWARLRVSIDEVKAQAFISAAQAKAKAEWEASEAAAKPAAVDPGVAKPVVEVPVDGVATPGAQAPAETAAQSAPLTAAAATPDLSAAPRPEAPLGVRDPAADATARLAALKDEVAAAGARFQERAFVLPSYKASNLNRDLEAYLKPKG